jgi:hypothetical protein
MRAPFDGSLFIGCVGVAMLLAGAAGLLLGVVHFLGKGGHLVTIARASEPALYWFVTAFYIVGGVVAVLLAAQQSRAERLPRR